MNGAERIMAMFERRPVDRPGFWMGAPTEETLQKYLAQTGLDSHESLSDYMQDDIFWAAAEWSCWRHPEGKPMWDFLPGRERRSIVDAGCFAECEDVAEVEAFPWPNPDYLVFDDYLSYVDRIQQKGKLVFGGFWTYIFQIAVDFFGMENLFIKMYTDPDVVSAVIDHVVEFYLEASRRLYAAADGRLKVFFFANDLGSQIDALISPEFFRKFFAPGFKKVIELAKANGQRVMLHSCGSVAKLIPDLIDLGIEGLHPLQAKAAGMDAKSLSQYKEHLVFMGGVDTQELLPFKKPADVAAEVRRLCDVLGDNFIVSPSHEGVLPNIPFENMLAMRDAVIKG